MIQRGGTVSFQETFKALSDSTRREILDLLKEGSLSAGEICSHFEMTGATVSHHLNILKNANLITDEKQGKYIYYELNLSVFEEVIHWFQSFKEEK
jgi:DNA-binding transcriptional ArsR family regulator